MEANTQEPEETTVIISYDEQVVEVWVNGVRVPADRYKVEGNKVTFFIEESIGELAHG